MSKFIDGVEVFTASEAKKLNGSFKVIYPVGTINKVCGYVNKNDRIPTGYTGTCFKMYKKEADGFYHHYNFAGVYEEMKEHIPEGYVRKKPHADSIYHRDIKVKATRKPQARLNKSVSNDKPFKPANKMNCSFVGHDENFVYATMKDGSEYEFPLISSQIAAFRKKGPKDEGPVVKNPLMKNILNEYKETGDLRKFCEQVVENEADIARLNAEDFNPLFVVDKSSVNRKYISKHVSLRFRAALDVNSEVKLYRSPVTRKLIHSGKMYDFRKSVLFHECKAYLM